MSSRALLCGFPPVDTCFLAQMVVYEIIAFVLTDAPDATLTCAMSIAASLSVLFRGNRDRMQHADVSVANFHPLI